MDALEKLIAEKIELESLLRESRSYVEGIIRIAESNKQDHEQSSALLEEIDKVLDKS